MVSYKYFNENTFVTLNIHIFYDFLLFFGSTIYKCTHFILHKYLHIYFKDSLNNFLNILYNCKMFLK